MRLRLAKQLLCRAWLGFGAGLGTGLVTGLGLGLGVGLQLLRRAEHEARRLLARAVARPVTLRREHAPREAHLVRVGGGLGLG